MYNFEKLLYQNDLKYSKINNKIFEKILNEFLTTNNLYFDFVNCTTPETKLISLKNQYIYTSEYNDAFFKLLTKYNYNMKHEIKHAIKILAYLDNPSNNSDTIKELLNSPVIQDISFDGKSKYKIFSEQFGEITFELAKYYFKENTLMLNYINNENLENYCHHNAQFIANIFPEFYSITSLCQYYFKGTYYHSYSYEKQSNNIIDLNYKSIIAKDIYDNIFETNEISKFPNYEFEAKLKLASLNTPQLKNICALLKIALYQQYLTQRNNNVINKVLSKIRNGSKQI